MEQVGLSIQINRFIGAISSYLAHRLAVSVNGFIFHLLYNIFQSHPRQFYLPCHVFYKNKIKMYIFIHLFIFSYIILYACLEILIFIRDAQYIVTILVIGLLNWSVSDDI